MRPGRLDRILYVGPPDQGGREEILRIRTAKMAVDPALDVAELASMVCYLGICDVPADVVYSDRWVLRSRDCCHVPGCGAPDDAARHGRPIRMWDFIAFAHGGMPDDAATGNKQRLRDRCTKCAEADHA